MEKEMNEDKEYREQVNLSLDIRTAYRGTNALDEMGLAIRLHSFGYRLDPMPNGKSKPELIAIIEAKQAELDRARVLLHETRNYVTLKSVDDFLTETSTVKS